MTDNKEKKFGPESRFIHSLKGKRVEVFLDSGEYVKGTLAWVDIYFLGLDVIGHDKSTTQYAIRRGGISRYCAAPKRDGDETNGQAGDSTADRLQRLPGTHSALEKAGPEGSGGKA